MFTTNVQPSTNNQFIGVIIGMIYMSRHKTVPVIRAPQLSATQPLNARPHWRPNLAIKYSLAACRCKPGD
jgi:hypothetical protein